MTDDEARAWFYRQFDAAACLRVEQFIELLRAESEHQNLVAPSTLAALWTRHIADSAQLLDHAKVGWRNWIDVGTGAGFPGLIIGLISPDREVMLVEPRRKRAEFLQHCVSVLGLARTSVRQSKVETINGGFDVISARAVGPIDNLLVAACKCAHSASRWLLPRGQVSDADRALLSGFERSTFHVEHSITNPQSRLVIIDGTGQ